MRLAVIGTGYVGLVTGACLAETGNTVYCIDINQQKIDTLKAGKVPFFEPGLEALIQENYNAGRMVFTTDIAEGVKKAEIVFICVGTPMGDDGSADLSQVFSAARMIGEAMDGYRIVCTKSTVPVGTADKVRDILAKHTTHPFDVASNPEFLKEGAAVNDCMKPDRIIVGTSSQRVRDTMEELYAPFIRTNNPVVFMDVRSSEMTKYASNALLATRISFMNEVAKLCEQVGASVGDVRRGMGADQRIGYQFLFPGIGYGGSCFPKDVRALAFTGGEFGVDMEILKAVDRVNMSMRARIGLPKIVSRTSAPSLSSTGETKSIPSSLNA
jgi:UDPglucose 6-dehydrogenase